MGTVPLKKKRGTIELPLILRLRFPFMSCVNKRDKMLLKRLPKKIIQKILLKNYKKWQKVKKAKKKKKV